MSKRPRNPVAKALRSPHLAQRRLPARPKQRKPDYEELLDGVMERHTLSLRMLSEDEQDAAYIEAISADWDEE